MKVHVLPGDALTETFQKTEIEGEIIVCRECLVDGDVKADSLEDFWQTRAGFIDKTYGSAEEYLKGVKSEFEKLQINARNGAEINLWFEYELFCQANYWFTLSLLQRENSAKIFRVAPVVREVNEIWKGFGKLSAADFERCFASRVELSAADIELGADLWQAFQANDYEKLEGLSKNESAAFPYLAEVCRAAIEKPTRPRKVLEEIIADGKKDFAREIFPAFAAKAGVYGFGDEQVKRILTEI